MGDTDFHRKIFMFKNLYRIGFICLIRVPFRTTIAQNESWPSLRDLARLSKI